MNNESDIIQPYTTDKIIHDLSMPINNWASLGFMRGLAGIRSEILPKGKMTLPSAAFTAKANQTMLNGDPDLSEIERRRVYINTVDSSLREMQGKAINKHFYRAALGQFVDLIVAIFIGILIVGMIVRLGAFHWITLSLTFLLGVKLIFMNVSIKRFLKISQKAFKAESENITMPWE